MTSHVVIGGCGFIGRHLVRALAASGEAVTSVDRVSFPDATIPVRSMIEDVTEASEKTFDAIVGGADVVHHYAWTTIPALANADPFADLHANLRITIGLLDALKRRGGGKIVFASSGGTVYGPLLTIPAPETHPLNPITAYGVSKVAAEKYLQYYRHMFGIDARVVRISNPYGAGQNPEAKQGAVTTFVHRAIAGQLIEVWGDGNTVRDFIHIDDLVPALVNAAVSSSVLNHPMPVYNIGSGSPSSINDVLQCIRDIMGKEILVEYRPTRSFDIPINVLDITKANVELNWKPRLILQEGMRKTVRDLELDSNRWFSN